MLQTTGGLNMIKESFYTDNFMTADEIRKTASTKLHQKTCPTCARKLVNLYYKQGTWKCKKCWDNFEKYMDTMNEGE